MTEPIFQKGLMSIKQICQRNVIFVTIGILKILVLNMRLIFAMVVIIQCKKLLVLIMLLLYMLREMLTEFIIGISVKMIQLKQWMVLT